MAERTLGLLENYLEYCLGIWKVRRKLSVLLPLLLAEQRLHKLYFVWSLIVPRQNQIHSCWYINKLEKIMSTGTKTCCHIYEEIMQTADERAFYCHWLFFESRFENLEKIFSLCIYFKYYLGSRIYSCLFSGNDRLF